MAVAVRLFGERARAWPRESSVNGIDKFPPEVRGRSPQGQLVDWLGGYFLLLMSAHADDQYGG